MPTLKQTRLAENIASGEYSTKTEAMLAAGYSPVSASASAAVVLGSTGVATALEQARQDRSDKASAVDRVKRAIEARLDVSKIPQDQLMAYWGAASKLWLEYHRAGVLNNETSVSMADHIRERYARARSMLRVLRFALRSPTRAARLAVQLAEMIEPGSGNGGQRG